MFQTLRPPLSTSALVGAVGTGMSTWPMPPAQLLFPAWDAETKGSETIHPQIMPSAGKKVTIHERKDPNWIELVCANHI